MHFKAHRQQESSRIFAAGPLTPSVHAYRGVINPERGKIHLEQAVIAEAISGVMFTKNHKKTRVKLQQ